MLEWKTTQMFIAMVRFHVPQQRWLKLIMSYTDVMATGGDLLFPG